MNRKRLHGLLLFVLLVFYSGGLASAQEGTPAEPITWLNMRPGPSESGAAITTLNPGTSIVLEARDANAYWVLVHTADEGARGWVSTCCLSVPPDFEYTSLPVSDEQVSANQAAQAPEDAPAQQLESGGETVRTTTALKLREGPSQDDEVITVLALGTQLIVDRRDSYWARVHTPDEQLWGWVSTCCIEADAGSGAAPAAPTQAPAAVQAPQPVQSADSLGLPVPQYQYASAREADIVARLLQIPIVPGIGGRAQAIFNTGQAMGNRADVFAKVGDCMTTFHAFLLPFGSGEYVLGDYAYLQPTIEFYWQTSPREHVANSFVNDSLAARDGFSVGSVTEPGWANTQFCGHDESPLACEYRIIKPAVAILLFGAVDVHYLSADEFRYYLSRAVEFSIGQGVIPVLNTIPADWDYRWAEMLELNNVVVDVAQAYGVPLVNLWRATQALNHGGVNPADRLHLSFDGSRTIDFTGDPVAWDGYTMRNLVTLQTLDALRRAVLAP